MFLFGYTPEIQLKILDKRLNLIVILRRDETGCLEEGGAMSLDRLARRAEAVADKPVGDVDMGGEVFGRGVLLEQGTDSDAELGVFGQLVGPVLEAIYVGEGNHFASFESQDPVIKAGLAAGGQPEIFGHQAGTDEGGFLGFNQGDGLVRVRRQEVLAKEALGKSPVCRQLASSLHQGVDPGDSVGRVFVLDAVTCIRVVFHHLASAAAAQRVDLKINDVSGAGDAETIHIDKVVDHSRIQEGAEKCYQGRIIVVADAAGDDVPGQKAGWCRLGLVEPGRSVFSPVLTRLQIWMVGIELLRGVVVAAGGLVVAAADSLVKRLVGFVHIAGEASFASARRTGITGCNTHVFLQVIHCREGSFHVSTAERGVTAVDDVDKVDS